MGGRGRNLGSVPEGTLAPMGRVLLDETFSESQEEVKKTSNSMLPGEPRETDFDRTFLQEHFALVFECSFRNTCCERILR